MATKRRSSYRKKRVVRRRKTKRSTRYVKKRRYYKRRYGYRRRYGVSKIGWYRPRINYRKRKADDMMYFAASQPDVQLPMEVPFSQ